MMLIFREDELVCLFVLFHYIVPKDLDITSKCVTQYSYFYKDFSVTISAGSK